MYIISCENCGFYEEKDFVATTICQNCGHSLIIESEKEDNEIADMIDNGEGYIPKEEHIKDSQCIKHIKQAINKMGHKEVWRVIEDMPNAYDRAYYRQIFKKAGGQYESI